MIRITLGLLALAISLCASPADAAARFLVACTTACTWDNSSTLIWSTTSGGAPGSAAPTSADAVTLDANSCVGGVTCTITVNANLSLQSLTTGACTASTTGCVLDFSVNNNNVTIGGANAGWNGSGTGTRVINLGSGTFTFTDTSGNLWNFTTTTNLTLNAGTSTILFQATSPNGTRTFIPGTKTYATFSVINSPINTALVQISGSLTPTFGTISLTGVRQFAFPQNTTTTISGAFNYSGVSNQYGMLYAGSGVAGVLAPTISVANSNTLQYLVIQGLIQSGAGALICNPCIDGGGNTLSSTFTITPPSGGNHVI